MKKETLTEFKKEDIKEFKNTKRGSKVYPNIAKLMIDGIACFICAIFIIITTIVYKDGIYFYILAFILVLFGIYFIYISNHLKRHEISMMKKKKKEKEEKKD